MTATTHARGAGDRTRCGRRVLFVPTVAHPSAVTCKLCRRALARHKLTLPGLEAPADSELYGEPVEAPRRRRR